MEKLLRTVEQPNGFQYMIFCPACKCGHGLRVGQIDGPNWTFNGDMEKPTFRPSLLINYVKWPDKDPATNDFKRGADGEYLTDGNKLIGAKDMVCHSYITDGKIEFLSDCTHELAGKTVNLEKF